MSRRVFRGSRISGAKDRDKRLSLDRLLKAGARRGVDMVAAWSVDRLGPSLIDPLDFLRELHAKGVDLFLHQQGIDTSMPSGQIVRAWRGPWAPDGDPCPGWGNLSRIRLSSRLSWQRSISRRHAALS